MIFYIYIIFYFYCYFILFYIVSKIRGKIKKEYNLNFIKKYSFANIFIFLKLCIFKSLMFNI